MKRDSSQQDAAAVKKRSDKAKAATKSYVDRTLNCRYELKYIVSESQAEAIEQFVRPYIEMDKYSKLQPEGFYPIVSLYLDTPDLQLAHETMDAKQNRFKLRIRSYSDDLQYPAFFEIKRRINRVIFKSRARVRHEDIPMLLQGRTLPPRDFHTDLEGLNQFQLYQFHLHAGPITLVRYARKAYEGGTQNRVRVTFDRDLCYKVTNKAEVTLGGPGWQHNDLTRRAIILEIKYTGVYPIWLNRMVSTFNLDPKGVSKYTSSMVQSSGKGLYDMAYRKEF